LQAHGFADSENCSGPGFRDLAHWTSNYLMSYLLKNGTYHPFGARFGQMKTEPPRLTCVVRAEFLHDKGYTFFSNEYAMHTADGEESFRTAGVDSAT
jgi:hypothetical protein